MAGDSKKLRGFIYIVVVDHVGRQKGFSISGSYIS